jgi:hypothetical protein
MDKNELLIWYKSVYSEMMPKFIEVNDANDSQIYFNGKWQNSFFSWSLFAVGNDWKYVETDSDRGYVIDLKAFSTEAKAVEYALNTLNRRYLATKGSSKEEMLTRYIQQKYGYTEKRADSMICQMKKYEDVFEEFYNYARTGKFCKRDKSQVEVHGYTAEVLNRDYNLSPLGAYNYLVYLIEEPEKAIADLKAGLPRK